MATKKPLNKSTFLESWVCPTRGWYYYHGYRDEETSISDQRRMDEGRQIGELARQLYPEGHLLESLSIDQASIATQKLLKQANILFEAAFIKQPFATRADILKRIDDGWELVEVKSSTDFAQKRKGEQQPLIEDMAYTLMVINDAIPVKKVSIMTLSKDFRLGMELVDLFVMADVTETVYAQMELFSKDSPKLAKLVQSEHMPNPEWLHDCKQCEFFKTRCLGKNSEYPVLELPRIQKNKSEAFFAESCYEIKSISNDFDLNDKQLRVKQAVDTNQAVYDLQQLREQLSQIEWPAYYLDFETFKTAYPKYEDVAPHDQVVTQYSIHQLEHIDAQPEHFEYLADPKHDCRRELAKQLIQDIGETGSVVVYSSFEKRILNDLNKLFPDLGDKLDAIINRLVDLQKIIENYYYHPAFHGSFSIKKVLPVLVPNMSYKSLDIQDGDTAIVVFIKMLEEDLSERELKIYRKQLLEYCQQDTWAMVELHKCMVRLADEIK